MNNPAKKKSLIVRKNRHGPGYTTFPQHRINALNPERGTLDISKAKSVLGYTPSHDLKSGLTKYIDWYKSCWEIDEITSSPAERNE